MYSTPHCMSRSSQLFSTVSFTIFEACMLFSVPDLGTVKDSAAKQKRQQIHKEKQTKTGVNREKLRKTHEHMWFLSFPERFLGFSLFVFSMDVYKGRISKTTLQISFKSSKNQSLVGFLCFDPWNEEHRTILPNPWSPAFKQHVKGFWKPFKWPTTPP